MGVRSKFLAALFIASIVFVARGMAAEATTGSVSGIVRSSTYAPIAGALVVAVSPSGRYRATTRADGRFALLGMAPDDYTVSVSAAGYDPASRAAVLVTAGTRVDVDFRLVERLNTIATVRSTSSSFNVGSTSDAFTVNGATARAQSPVTSISGLGSYSQGSVQGAIAGVPGVDEDSFGNAILRGGKIDDASFEYDAVPVPQGLVAEPGGNIVGAQLPTTGIASTTVTLAGYQTQTENALGGVVDEIPATGVYPGRTVATLTDGIGALNQGVSLESLWATPDLRWRYAFALDESSQYFAYGDGRTFYPAEIATYGLALQTRGQSAASANAHYALDSRDDLSLTTLFGMAAYDQYDSPYAGETENGMPVHDASGLRGNYDLVKAAWTRTFAHSVSQLQLYDTSYGSSAGGPFWDDLSFPDGVISLSEEQHARETGVSYDIDDFASARHEFKYGLDARTNTSFLDQTVPTADEYIHSNPTLSSYLLYAGDVWSPSDRFSLAAFARASGTRIAASDGSPYTIGAVDPHLAASYRLTRGLYARITYDRNTVAPKPLEADRVDSTSPAPFTPLAPEIGRNVTYSIESNGRTHVRFTYYSESEFNRIDVLPYNFRSAIAADESPGGVGVPTNAGELRARGAELWLRSGGLSLDVNAIRAYSSSASQFAYNGLNAAAVAAGHLFPVSYVPDLGAVLSYEFAFDRRSLRVTPSFSYESGYPYGNGKMTWTFGPGGKPVEVPNDNYVNPGYSYYFLRNPAEPYNALTNPYVGSLGTNEGDDPNTLRTTPQTIVSLHVEDDVAPHVTAVFDLFNALGVATPTQMQGNPYLIGPPGYAGGNPLYASAYEAAGGFSMPYTLGNGVPTNDGQTPAVPWSYGRAGYVPMSYPMARTVQLMLRFTLP